MATPPTVAEFLADYPEFTGCPETLIQKRLDLAVLRTDATVWGSAYQAGVKLRAADLLAKTPEGKAMRLMLDSGKSIFWDDLQGMIRRVAACGFRVT